MRCEEVQLDLSASFDGEDTTAPPADVDAHVRGCEACTAFGHRLREIRVGLRIEAVETVPELVPRHRSAHLRTQSTRREGLRYRLLSAAAVVAAGALAGASLVVLTDDGDRVAAADLADRVLSAQHAIESLEADLTLVERGWHPDVPERVFSGRLVYEAPERLRLTLEDGTAYPDPRWVANDVSLVVDGSTRWTSGPRDCPVVAQPECTPSQHRVHAVTDREPFDDASPVPLELVTPVDSFLPGGLAVSLGTRRIDGRWAVGVRVPAAQVAELVAAVRPAGNLRLVHPSDPVELWLDERSMVPVDLRVTAADQDERRRWALANGYVDEPGDVVVELRVSGLALNEPVSDQAFPPPPSNSIVVTAGFGDDEPSGTLPGHVPHGFSPYRRGTVRTGGGPTVAVRSWTDGRAWLKIRATAQWPGGRLFGDVGPLVRPVSLGAAGIAYQNEDGTALAMHADAVDLVVTGTVPATVLRDVAASLGVIGTQVPADWAESGAATVDDARRVIPGLLLPLDLEGFAPPAVAVDAPRVSLSYAGPGDRAFLLVEVPGERLAPPLDPDAQAVDLRRGTGRWSPSRGELEWVESGLVVTLRSRTMTLPELLAVAASLEAP